MANVSDHTCSTSEWYTPPWLVEKARTVLGAIGTDPASCYLAQQTVKAHRWLGPNKELESQGWDSHGDWAGPDGVITSRWAGSVFLNPPGGNKGQNVKDFWYAAQWWYENTGESVFWVGFNLNQLCTLQDIGGGPLAYTTCILRKRIQFVGLAEQPRHHSYVTLLAEFYSTARLRFRSEFNELGRIV